jgi:hypothetical protein
VLPVVHLEAIEIGSSARFVHVGRVAVNKLGAGEGIRGEKGKAVALQKTKARSIIAVSGGAAGCIIISGDGTRDSLKMTKNQPLGRFLAFSQ